jgi:curli biogenesis system outer membrane secretion channel CsgG
MNKWAMVFLVLAAAVESPAETNAPVRLAVVSETSEAMTVADVLTAQLTGNSKIQLLERDQIEKVYREQGMSEANRDDVKVGRILGADGLLLLNVVRTPQTTNLTARLIAVKPGVVLTDGSFPWPLKDAAQWADAAVTYLDSFLPKLTVLAKDAIPISIVNLRAAVSSADEQETERDLKLLTIQRLSQERQLFVLERQKMQLLSQEKELKSDESAFWDGSYLLDGIVDQNGYSKNTVTVDARLTPPKGGAPLSFEVSGSRTNLAEVVNRLAVKVTELLKVQSTVPEWNAANEAAQYFDEAKWALRWGIYPEAQAAAESSWALGKHDVDCAMVRVQAYMVSPDAGESVIVYPPREPPDQQNIIFTLHALKLYDEFSRNLPFDEFKIDSPWYLLGLKDLTVASRVLQVFNWSPDYYRPAAEKLAELRAATRSTAEWISRIPAVHDSYYVGNRVANCNELDHFHSQPSIFGLEVDCGCLWQETPEDSVALYRELMSSPVFCYLHDRFWFRDTYHRSSLFMLPPRLIAWNETDQKRIPYVWSNFVRELSTSTNVLLRLEAKALLLADAKPGTNLAESFTNFFGVFFENRDALVANKVEVLHLDWQIGDLVERMGGDEFANEKLLEAKESLEHLYYSEYRPKIEAMDQEYRDKTVFLSTFDKQKRYLKENRPYDFFTFAPLFGSTTYSRTQAVEIQPLFDAYLSNLVTQSKSAIGQQKAELEGAIGFVSLMRDNANRVLHPPALAPRAQPKSQAPKPVPVASTTTVAPLVTNAAEIVTNVIAVNQFFPIPWERLVELDKFQHIEDSTVNVTAHHWFEGRLLLNFEYGVGIQWRDEKGKIIGGSNVNGPAIAIFNPETGDWEIVGCPEVDVVSQNRFYHRTALFHGELFASDDGQIRKYDFDGRRWETLKISDGNNYELFVVNGHLYAANRDIIFEILDDGQATHILASTRRQPSMSALDTQELGVPTLFPGPNHSLRVSTSNKIFSWTGSDWREDAGKPATSFQPELSMGGVIFRQAGSLNAGWQNGVLVRQANGTYGSVASQDEISCLPNESNNATLYLGSRNQFGGGRFSMPGREVIQAPKPLWEAPVNLLPNPPAALCQSGLYLLEDSFAVHAVINGQHQILQEQVAGKDRYNAAILRFSPGYPMPQKLFLKFAHADAEPASWIFPTTNFIFLGSESSFDNPAGGFIGSHGGKAGIWAIPMREIKGPLRVQEETQLAEIAENQKRALAAKEQRHKDVLAKYDLNHNGKIDLEEREAALADPAFIESELDTIDVNHDGRLDAPELIWFDANRNGILDPPEEAGLAIAQKLLAARMIKNFGQNGGEGLDQNEFANALANDPMTGGSVGVRAQMDFVRYDQNHDGKLDSEELQLCLEQRTVQDVRGVFRRMQPHAMSFLLRQPRPEFKEILEMYWQVSAANANQSLPLEQIDRTQTNAPPVQ